MGCRVRCVLCCVVLEWVCGDCEGGEFEGLFFLGEDGGVCVAWEGREMPGSKAARQGLVRGLHAYRHHCSEAVVLA